MIENPGGARWSPGGPYRVVRNAVDKERQFLAAPLDKASGVQDRAPLLELTYNYDPEVYGGGRNFGHLAFEVDDIYKTCAKLQSAGVTINRPPREGRMAFVKSPDNISIELLQKGESLPKAEPWASMPNTGTW